MATLCKHGLEQLLMCNQGDAESADGYQVMGSSLNMDTLLAAWAGYNGMTSFAACVISTGQWLTTGGTAGERGCCTAGKGLVGVAPQTRCWHRGLTGGAPCQEALLAFLHGLCSLHAQFLATLAYRRYSVAAAAVCLHDCNIIKSQQITQKQLIEQCDLDP